MTGHGHVLKSGVGVKILFENILHSFLYLIFLHFTENVLRVKS